MFAKEFCEVKNIEKNNVEALNCIDAQTVFGYIEFISKTDEFIYILDNNFKLQIISTYYENIQIFIEKFCSKNKKIRIKDVTNYDKFMNNYKTKIILSCTFERT